MTERGKEMDQTNQDKRASVDRVVHTPGPWRTSNVISAYEVRRRKIVAAEESPEAGTGICEVYGVEDADNIANANLIAAAPELAECLRGLYDVQNGVPLGKYESEWNALMDKAEELFQRLGV